MSLTEEQMAALERLQEDESLTDNLLDRAARALLHWAEEQLLDRQPADRVLAAVRVANRSDATSIEEALTAARQALRAMSERPSPQRNSSPAPRGVGTAAGPVVDDGPLLRSTEPPWCEPPDSDLWS